MGRVEMTDVGPLGPGGLQGEAGLVGGQVWCPEPPQRRRARTDLREGRLGPQGRPPRAPFHGDAPGPGKLKEH